MGWKICQTCQGNGKIIAINKKGHPEEQPCPARCINGKINTGLI
jgi:hypothetical protein